MIFTILMQSLKTCRTVLVIGIWLTLVHIGCQSSRSTSQPSMALGTTDSVEKTSSAKPPWQAPKYLLPRPHHKKIGSKDYRRVYRGKYAGEAVVKQWRAQINKLKERSLELLASRWGVDYIDKDNVSFLLADLPPRPPAMPYLLQNGFLRGRPHRYVYLFTEYLYTGREKLTYLVPMAYGEVVLREKLGKHYGQLPLWLRRGLLLYLSDYGSVVVQRRLNSIVETPYFPKYLVQGLVARALKYPALEGFLALQYMQDCYGAKALKSFCRAVIVQGMDWQEALQVQMEPFLQLQAKVRMYALSVLGKEQVREPLAQYRYALKAYIAGNNPRAIALWQQLYFRYGDVFLAGRLHYRMGRAYCALGKYTKASRAFERVWHDFASTCLVVDLAYYRYGLACRHRGKLSRAVEVFSELLQNFPHSDRQAPACLWLARTLREQHRFKRALHWLAHFARHFPTHHLMPQALLEQAQLAQACYLLHRATQNYQQLLQQFRHSEQAEQAPLALARLQSLANNPPPQPASKRIAQLLQELASDDPALVNAARQELIDIGKWCLPMIEQAMPTASISLARHYVAVLAGIGDSAANNALLLALQKPDDTLALATGRAFLQIGVPSHLMPQILEISKQGRDAAYGRRVQQVLTALLWDSTPALRRQLPDLIAKLNNSPAVQLEAIEELVRLGQPACVPVWARLLQHASDSQVRLKAGQALAVWAAGRSPGAWYSVVEAAFLAALKDPDEHVRRLAIRSLSRLGSHKARQPLIAATHDHSLLIRQAALSAMAQIGPTGWPVLIAALDDPSYPIRTHAYEVLMASPTAKVVPALLKALKKPDLTYPIMVKLLQIFQIKTRITVAIPARPISLKERLRRVARLESLYQLR